MVQCPAAEQEPAVTFSTFSGKHCMAVTPFSPQIKPCAFLQQGNMKLSSCSSSAIRSGLAAKARPQAMASISCNMEQRKTGKALGSLQTRLSQCDLSHIETRAASNFIGFFCFPLQTHSRSRRFSFSNRASAQKKLHEARSQRAPLSRRFFPPSVGPSTRRGSPCPDSPAAA